MSLLHFITLWIEENIVKTDQIEDKFIDRSKYVVRMIKTCLPRRELTEML